MNDTALTTPKQFIARGMVSEEMMQSQLDMARIVAADIRRDYPNASVVMDEDNILRIEASAADAGEIEYELQERLSSFTPFSIKVRE